jgi:hypothetical protein
MKKLLIATAALVASLAGGLYAANTGHAVDNVPNSSQLEPFGLVLSNPQGAVPMRAAPVVTDAAVAAAHSSALQTQYLHCVDPNASPAIDEDCWVVSVDPSNIRVHGIPGQPDPKPATWALVLVNATTDTPEQEFYSNN